MTETEYHAGFVAVIGRPNTGKSTLINALVQEKISIVTSKPQTTRHSILGILTEPDVQIVFVDTPGLHRGSSRLINRAMNRSAAASMVGADLALFVTDATGWTRGDDHALGRLQEADIPAFLVINKLDLLKRRTDLLPILDNFSARGNFGEIIPISARQGKNLDRLLGAGAHNRSLRRLGQRLQRRGGRRLRVPAQRNHDLRLGRGPLRGG